MSNYSRTARIYDLIHIDKNKSRGSIFLTYLNFSSKRSLSNILDVGCGTALTQYASQKKIISLGIDLSNDMIQFKRDIIKKI